MGNTINVSLLPAYTEAASTWQQFASVQSAADFRPQSSVRAGVLGELERVGSTGEIKHAGPFQEDAINWQIDTYARMLRITRQDVINDNLGFLQSLPTELGRMSGRSISSLVWKTWMNNGSFFTSGHGNLLTGAGSALSVTSLGQAITAMRKQTDGQGNALAIEPKYLVVPPELEITARQIINSTLLGVTSGGPTGNPVAGIVGVVVEPRLSNALYTGYSATAWYLSAGPSGGSIIVGFLDGKTGPTVESFGLDADIDTLGYSFRCYFDYGTALGDYRSAVKANGA